MVNFCEHLRDVDGRLALDCEILSQAVFKFELSLCLLTLASCSSLGYEYSQERREDTKLISLAYSEYFFLQNNNCVGVAAKCCGHSTSVNNGGEHEAPSLEERVR